MSDVASDPAADESIWQALEAALPGRVRRDAPLGALTTWRVGGPAAATVELHAPEELELVARAVPEGVPRLVLGRGSNLLVADAGFAGLVVVLGPEFATIAVGDRTVTAGGATALPVLARRCAAEGRSGLGFYVGIPGSVGGAVRMNAGGHGRETIEVLTGATVADLDAGGVARPWTPEDLDLGYRSSALGPAQIVLDATFAVTPTPDAVEELRAELRDIVQWRSVHQPGGANAGSVFRNPPGDAAGRLIDEECGLRGARVGGAVVSEKHANFIQADDGATAADVRALIEHVREAVAARTGVDLEVEVHCVGFAD